MKQDLTRSERSRCVTVMFRHITLLAIETGRFNGASEENRICLLCGLGVIEYVCDVLP